MPALAAVRLPPGWLSGSDGDGAVAGPLPRRPGDPLVFHRSAPLPPGGVPAVLAGTVAGLDARQHELQVLDREPVAARRGSVGERLLTTWRDGVRSLTAEHWLLAHSGRLHVLAAVMDTRCYAAAAEPVRRSFSMFCPGRSTSFGASPAVGDLPVTTRTGTEAIAAVEVLAGRRAGVGAVAVRGQVAVVDLPGIPGRTTLPAALVPGWIAGLVQLGPRPLPAVTSSLVLGRDGLAALLDGCAPVGVPSPWREVLAGARGDLVAHWRLTPLDVSPPAPRAPRALEVLDLGHRGLWRLGTADEAWLAIELAGEPPPADPVVVTATSATAVWEALSTA